MGCRQSRANHPNSSIHHEASIKPSRSSTIQNDSYPQFWSNQGECQTKCGAWSSSYGKLSNLSDRDVIKRLDELPPRAWQAIWEKMLLSFVTSAEQIQPSSLSNLLSPGNNTSTQWRLIGDVALNKAHVKDILQNDKYAKRLIQAMHGILRIQEELSWLSKILATAFQDTKLRSTFLQKIMLDLMEMLKRSPSQRTASERVTSKKTLDYLTEGEGSEEIDKCLALAQSENGLDYRGLKIRLVTSEDDWQSARHQMKCTRELFLEALAHPRSDGLQLLAAAPLITCIEGKGVRLVITPHLSSNQRVLMDRIPRQNLLYQRQPVLRGYMPVLERLKNEKFEFEYGRLASIFHSQTTATIRKSTPLLALSFPSINKLHEPTVLLATNRQDLITQTKKSLGDNAVAYNPTNSKFDDGTALHLELFGVMCEVQ